MPFDPATDPLDNYTIRIFFGGLLMLTPASQGSFNRANVFVIDHHSNDHELSVDVSIDEPQPTFPFLRLGDKFPRNELLISKTAPQGVKKFTGTPQPGVHPLPQQLDFKVLHSGATVKPSGQHRAVVKITDGLLHAPVLRTADSWLEKGGVCTPCTPALALGIRLVATMEDKVKLTWGGHTFELPRDEDPVGTKFLILVNNSRPIPAKVNDFKHLYHALDGVSAADQFNLAFDDCPSLDTTPRIPCIPGVVDG